MEIKGKVSLRRFRLCDALFLFDYFFHWFIDIGMVCFCKFMGIMCCILAASGGGSYLEAEAQF